MLKIKMASIVLTLTAGFIIFVVTVPLWAWNEVGKSSAVNIMPVSQTLSSVSSRQNTVSSGNGKSFESSSGQQKPVLSVSGAPVLPQELILGSQDGVTVTFKVDGFNTRDQGHGLWFYINNPNGLNICQRKVNSLGEVSITFKTDTAALADKKTSVSVTPYVYDHSRRIVSQAEAVKINFIIKSGAAQSVVAEENIQPGQSDIKVLGGRILIKDIQKGKGVVKLDVAGLTGIDIDQGFRVDWNEGTAAGESFYYDYFHDSTVRKSADNKYWSVQIPITVSSTEESSNGQVFSGVLEFNGKKVDFSVEFGPELLTQNKVRNQNNGWTEGVKSGVVGSYGVITDNDVDAIYSEEGIEYVKVTLISDWTDPDPLNNPVGDQVAGKVLYIDQKQLRTGIEDGLFMDSYESKVRLSDGTEAYGYMKAYSGTLLSHDRDLNTPEEIRSYAGSLPHWKGALELKQEFSDTGVLRPEGNGFNYLYTFLYGGLNANTQDFINWQSDVYADVDFGEQNELMFIQELTASIYRHNAYDKDIANWFSSGSEISQGFAIIPAAFKVLYNTYSNDFSIANKIENEQLVCSDLVTIENYMLGQQGIYSEVYFESAHVMLKVNYDGVDYIVDPTNNEVMPLSDYRKDGIAFLQELEPNVRGGSFYKQP